MAIQTKERKSLLSSQVRVQAPWIKVTIGKYTFGVYSKSKARLTDDAGFYQAFNVQYPNYVKSVAITKINGQINTYSLQLVYPIKPGDDPNFFEKVFSSVSKTRKITFSYGDASAPAFAYRNEEAIITNVSQSFNLDSSTISYAVTAVSAAALGKMGSFTFMHSEALKPSDEIKRVFRDSVYGLQRLFSGMKPADLDKLIDGSDARVELQTKTNISPLDYIMYLVGCMRPDGDAQSDRSGAIYVLTIHDDAEQAALDGTRSGGPYFEVRRTTYAKSYSDAYEIDVGYNTSTIVTNFQIDRNENYSMYYDYTKELYPEEYARRLGTDGKWEDVYAPMFSSKNELYQPKPEDASWYAKMTKYPVSASITVQGLLRPATLMQYVRLNVIFPGGGKHVSSGLYIVTKQQDLINEQGYRTTLSLAKIDGDDFYQ